MATCLLADIRIVARGWLMLAVVAVGCQKPSADPPAKPVESRLPELAEEPGQRVEPPWNLQIAAVKAGESDTIHTHQRVNEAQLKLLPPLGESLQHLLIDAGEVTDDGLQQIAQLPQLIHLRMRESPITDQGLAHLSQAGMPQLRILNLPQARVGAEGIHSLRELPRLEQLRLGGTTLDDAAAEELAQLPALRSLHLIGPSLTAQGLTALAHAPRLGSLYVDDCPLPDEAWEHLFAAKPNMHVHIDQSHHDRDPNAHGH